MRKLITLVLSGLLAISPVYASKYTGEIVQVTVDRPDINTSNFSYNNTTKEYTITTYESLKDVLKDASLRCLTNIVIHTPETSKEEFSKYLNSTFDASVITGANVKIWYVREKVVKLEYQVSYHLDFEALLAYRKPELYNSISYEARESLNRTIQILNSIITPDMKFLQKEKAVHDYLVNNVTYSFDAKGDIRSIYTLLFEGKGVCDAYARQFALMMNILGYDCRREVGMADDGLGGVGSHAWNVISVQGYEIPVDVTWDDLDNGSIRYDYFNVSPEDFYKDHYPDARQTSYYNWVR